MAIQLVVRDGMAARTFYEDALRAWVGVWKTDPQSGALLHARLQIAGQTVILSESSPSHGEAAPDEFGESAVTLHLFHPECDEIFQRAIDHGARLLMPLQRAPWGGLFGLFVDPAGHRWAINSPQEADDESDSSSSNR